MQARSVADESPVGSFTASGTGQRLSSCTTPEVSAQNKEKNISHSERHRCVCSRYLVYNTCIITTYLGFYYPEVHSFICVAVSPSLQ